MSWSITRVWNAFFCAKLCHCNLCADQANCMTARHIFCLYPGNKWKHRQGRRPPIHYSFTQLTSESRGCLVSQCHRCLVELSCSVLHKVLLLFFCNRCNRDDAIHVCRLVYWNGRWGGVRGEWESGWRDQGDENSRAADEMESMSRRGWTEGRMEINELVVVLWLVQVVSEQARKWESGLRHDSVRLHGLCGLRTVRLFSHLN